MWRGLIAISLAVGTLPAAADPPPNLIVLATPGPAQSPPGEFMHTYNAVFNMEALRSPASSITLNMPGRTPVVVSLARFEPRAGYLFIDVDGDLNDDVLVDPSTPPSGFSWRWYGRGEGWTVALTTELGVLAGRISGPGVAYGIYPRTRFTELGEINSAFWKSHADDTERGAATQLQPREVVELERAPWIPVAWNRFCTNAVPTGSHVVDVLVMYTSAAMSASGGTEAGVRAAVQAALDDANQSLRNANVLSTSFFLRGVEPIGFNYEGEFIDTALNIFGGFFPSGTAPYMTFPGNTVVLNRRNALQADVVALARSASDATCGASMIQRVASNGYAYEPGAAFESLAYLVFNPACNADRLNLAHELGHLLGMEHDPRNSEVTWLTGIDLSCPWSFGHRRPTGPDGFRFRTIMAYWQQGDGSGGPTGCASNDSCPAIDAYSQPAVEWGNYALHPSGTVAGAQRLVFPPPRPAD